MKYTLKNVMFGVGVLVLIFSMFSFLYSRQEHQKIVEEVSVDWMQVPVFAVDKAGRPVTDLKPGDINVTLNGQPLTTFDLQKRTFSITSKESTVIQQPSTKKIQVAKKKLIVLLFDISMSTKEFIQRAKRIARKIVSGARENTRFILMSLDPEMGLTYIGEAIATLPNKNQLIGMIKKKVTPKSTPRYIPITNIALLEMGMVSWISSRGAGLRDIHLRKSFIYFDSFKSLYFYLNSIEDNKMIYFFSEGIPNSAVLNIRGGASNYTNFINEMARDLGACGAVLFLINTMGVDQHTSTFQSKLRSTVLLDSASPLSGENMLRYLAIKSGAAYLEGVPDKIVERLENMHLAYYEISFPAPPQLKDNTMEINIKANQPGIIIHSLRSLEKQKLYADMNDMEKNMLMLNLITVNPLIEGKMQAYNVRTAKVKKSKKKVVYNIHIPPGYVNKTIDLYKYWVRNNQEVIHAKKEALEPKSSTLKIQFRMDQLKQKEPGEIETYFVMVDASVNSARVHGMDLYNEDPELPELKEKTQMTQIPGGGKTISAGEMKRILQGAADYCQRLKESAFHFYCREKIVETRIPLTGDRRQELNIDEASKTIIIDPRLTRRGVALPNSPEIYTQVKSHIFGYRLIKQGNQINEERDWISSGDNVKVKRDQVLKTNTFFSEKAVFAPITILDRGRQDKYNFQFIRCDQRNGRSIAVIETLPVNPVETSTIYGTLWIDMEDFSLVKIEAHPKSIRGYELLKNLAKKMRTRLQLSLEIDFDHQRKGIRFPTKVSFLEKYKGGRLISRSQGPKGWERTRAEFTYSDYRFFSVQTEVTVHQ